GNLLSIPVCRQQVFRGVQGLLEKRTTSLIKVMNRQGNFRPARPNPSEINDNAPGVRVQALLLFPALLMQPEQLGLGYAVSCLGAQGGGLEGEVRQDLIKIVSAKCGNPLGRDYRALSLVKLNQGDIE